MNDEMPTPEEQRRLLDGVDGEVGVAWRLVSAMHEQNAAGSYAEDLAYVSTVFNALADALVRFGRPMPPTVTRARGILERALSSSMSWQRQGIGADSARLDQENIGSDEVAEILGVTKRTVQRRAEALGGERISGAWVFNRDDIGVSSGEFA